jgi:MFS transporter, putative metabolite:H+ symporter
MTNFKTNHTPSYIYVTIALAAFGYFVNIYNLISFSMVGKTTLTLYTGTNEAHPAILGIQMTGALMGGIIWGIMGDRVGRVSGLFFSTLLCVVTSFGCAFLGEVSKDMVVPFYKVLRFLSGVGLAGELGVGIAMVSEVTHKFDEEVKGGIERIVGTTLVVCLGVLGGSVAAFIAHDSVIGPHGLIETQRDMLKQSCTNTYLVGAGLGLLLILLRTSIYGSNLYRHLKYSEEKRHILRGQWMQLLEKQQLKNLALCCVTSLPTWFVLGVLLENRAYFGYSNTSDTDTYGWSYLGLAAGSLINGVLTYKTKAHKQVLLGFHFLSFMSIAYYIFDTNDSSDSFTFKCFFIGIGRGYWNGFVAIIPELFGTNLRCLASSLVINCIRFMVVPYTFFLTGLTKIILNFYPFTDANHQVHTSLGDNNALLGALSSDYHQKPAIILAILLFVVIYFTITRYFKETYGKSLDFETY